jgi:hypothetical protein
MSEVKLNKKVEISDQIIFLKEKWKAVSNNRPNFEKKFP